MKILHVIGRNVLRNNSLQNIIKIQRQKGEQAYTSFWRIFLGKADILHVHDVKLMLLLSILTINIFYRKGLVFHFYSFKNKSLFEKLKYHFVSRTFPVIIFDGSHIKEEYLSKYKGNYIWHVFEKGINVDLLPAKTMGQPGIIKHVVGIGEIDASSNIHKIIESVRYLPVEFNFVYTGVVKDKDYLLYIKEVSKNLNVGRRVEFVILDKDDALGCNDILLDACLCVDLSPMLDLSELHMFSLALGTPVLCNSAKNYQIRGIYSVNSSNPKPLAAQIKDVVEKDAAVSSELARNLFRWESRVEALYPLYDTVV